LGGVYRQQGDYKNALECYETVTKISPDNADAYYEKGICLVKLGEKDEACESLKLALKNDADYKYDIQDDPEFDPLRDYNKFKALFN
jgi:tetratricopeptide (TPR) repeat protein